MRISDWSSDVCSSDLTISPLVDIRTRLVDQSNVEVFQVRSSGAEYWRLTSLERFDGRIWSSEGSFGRAGGELPSAVQADVAREVITQTCTIKALAAIWLPAAYEPRSLSGEDLQMRYDEESADRKSTRLNSSHLCAHRMPPSARNITTP